LAVCIFASVKLVRVWGTAPPFRLSKMRSSPKTQGSDGGLGSYSFGGEFLRPSTCKTHVTVCLAPKRRW